MRQVIANLWITTALLTLVACIGGDGSGDSSSGSGQNNPLSFTVLGYINGDTVDGYRFGGKLPRAK